MVVTIKKSDFDNITAYAKQSLPHEACGLVAGRKEKENIIPIPFRIFHAASLLLYPYHTMFSKGEKVGSTAQRYVLRLIPLQRLEKVIRLKIRPKPVYNEEIGINRLYRQKAGQSAHAAPANDQIDPRNIVRAECIANLSAVAAGRI